MPLLPVLESSYQKWIDDSEELQRRLPELGEAVERVVQIPPLLAAALDGEGDYWPALALGWLEASPELSIPTEALARLAEAGKSKPQSLRHRAAALLGRSRHARPE